MAKLDKLLAFLKQNDGSDLHLASGIAPHLRAKGSLHAIQGARAMGDAEMRALMRELVSPKQWDEFEEHLELDFAYGLQGVGRFRGNYFVQENGASAVFRLIPEQVKTLESLNMPAAVESFAHLRNGLVVVTGPTGSGKSTTLAAIIDKINATYDKHILTIEDPVEFVHQPQRALITQREVGTHTKSFESALRAALRENPDVILVGEMRGREVELALAAAEMGALVFGTLHTNSAAKTIDRLIDIFPTDEQEQIRMSLSEALAGVVAQLLLPTADGRGRCAAIEILMKTSGLPNIIREGNTPQLLSMMQGGKAVGMQTMDDALEALWRKGTVRAKDVLQRASDKQRFEQMFKEAERDQLGSM
ncbi:MAG TPA: PilT/PilU family type 4a pilus ATPase [Polyangiales bacterium]|jgi:twitching motility protein PilT|nr:PilT/PilU family type 4a pilus ATPase [Polyangiales bacterium]